MIPLSSLWALSLVLSALALFIMSGLIAARFVDGRRKRAITAQRDALLPLLLGASPDEDLLLLARSDPLILAELSLELIDLVRGEEREQFVATASRLGIPVTLRHQLKRGSRRVRTLAAEKLAQFPDEHCTAALEDALSDRDSSVRLAAALSLATSERAPPVRWLVDRLALGTDEQSMLIVTLLGDLARQRPEEVRALIEAKNVPGSIRAAAIEALTASGDYSLVGLITSLALEAAHDAPELPRYIRALGSFQHPAAHPAIIRGLASPTWWVRAAAAEAAGRISFEDTAEVLGALLDDPDWWVRFRAGEALVRLGRTGERQLTQIRQEGSERARDAARLTIAEQAVAA